MNSESSSPADRDRQSHGSSNGTASCYDDIALRAYFIALDRHRRGETGDPLKDWIEAEHQLLAHPSTGK